jgi:transposase, IS5 family
MYRKSNQPSNTLENFELPVAVQLSPDNRWVIMAELIPWSDFETEYAENFSEKMGAPAKPFRMALGALIIKEKLGTSDRETMEQIRENPYLQYFLGMSDYGNNPLFEASMMVYFRERIGMDLVKKINSDMVKNFIKKIEKSELEKKKNGKKLKKEKIKES